jgi:hypothetical protein
MKDTSYGFILGGLIICGSVVTSLSADTGRPETKSPWRIAGELEDACSCRPACPCWFKSKPSRMTCDGVQAVFVSRGYYGKTPLDGLAVVQFVQSPEDKSMFESFGSWNFDNVYIDEKADDDQRQALKEIAAHLFPPAAKSREFHFVSITRTIDGAEHTISVGNSGSFSGHLIEGGSSGPPKIINPPLADPTHREFFQGQSTKLTYSDAGQGWEYENSNYMFNRFKVDDKVYQKFEAEMAKKMAQMSPDAGK